MCLRVSVCVCFLSSSKLYHRLWSGCNYLLRCTHFWFNTTYLISLICLLCLCLVASCRVGDVQSSFSYPSLSTHSLCVYSDRGRSPHFLISWFKTPVVLPRFYAFAPNSVTPVWDGSSRTNLGTDLVLVWKFSNLLRLNRFGLEKAKTIQPKLNHCRFLTRTRDKLNAN